MLIPGPKKHGLINTFLWPLVQEIKALDNGIEGIYNYYTKKHFTLWAWITICCGDRPVKAEMIGMSSLGNAFRPCPHRRIQGINSRTKIYYVPHTNIDCNHLTIRTNLRQMISVWDTCSAVGNTDLGMMYGIKRKSILLELRSVHFPRSFPVDVMHCILLNVVVKILELWRGKRFEDEDKTSLQKSKVSVSAYAQPAPSPSETNALPFYVITEKKVWEEISHIQEQSRCMIPRLLGQGPRRIDSHIRGHMAKEWEALLVRDGPILFGDLPKSEPYLMNLMILRNIYLQSRNWDISPADVHQLQLNIVSFVETFERLYYQKDPARLKVCLTNNHMVLHLRRSSYRL
jgi:hypothetical protein